MTPHQSEFLDDFPGFPKREDAAADVVRRYFADRALKVLTTKLVESCERSVTG
jgi:hypothetical protein